MKILAIDDNPDNLTALEAVMQDALPGYTLLTALNGPRGLELALAEDPDVILLDIVMPGMDGYEVCRRLKADDQLRQIPVVFLTALRTDRESRIQALESGAEAFLSKPFDEQELVAEVRAMAKIKAATLMQRDEHARRRSLVAERTQELQQSEERFRALFEQAPMGYQSLDAEGRFIEVNQAWLETLGYLREEVIGKCFGDFLAPEFVDAFRERFPLFKAACHVHSEFQMLRKDGERRFIAFEGRIAHTPDGGFKQTHCILQDITESERTETALRESEARFAQLAAQSRTLAWEVDAKGLYTYVSHMTEDVTSYCPEELVGRMHFYDLHPETGREAFKQAAFAVFERKEPFRNLVNAIQRKDGSTVWGATNGDPLLNADGTLRGYRGSDTDITERQQAAAALREKLAELERVNTLMIGRENRMIELKREINDLCGQLKLPKRYSAPETVATEAKL